MQLMASPSRRPTTISVTSWARKTTSEGPLWPPSAHRRVRAEHQRSDGADAGARASTCRRTRLRSDTIMEGARPQSGRRSIVPCGESPTTRKFNPSTAACHAIANYLQQGYGGGERIVSMAVSSVPQERLASPLRITPKRAGVAAAARRLSSEVFGSIRTRPPGRSGTSSSPFSGPAIWSRSATWIPATGRPRSPAAPSSATRCSPSRFSPTSWRSCCRRCARGSASRPGAISRRPAATRFRARSRGRSGLLAEIAICATDLAEVIGTAIGLNLLFGIPLELGVIITALDVFLILVDAASRLPLDRGLHRDVARRDRGLLRDPDRARRSGMGRGDPRLCADDRDRHATRTCSISRIGIIGATVMPHNLYLHSGVVQTRALRRHGRGQARGDQARRPSTPPSR